jgi:hypothetical protein
MTGIPIAALRRDAVNRCEGDAAVVRLSQQSIRGNMRIPFSGMERGEVAGLMSDLMAAKKLDQRPQ